MDAVYPWGLTTGVIVTPDSKKTTEESAQVIFVTALVFYVFWTTVLITLCSPSCHCLQLSLVWPLSFSLYTVASFETTIPYISTLKGVNEK